MTNFSAKILGLLTSVENDTDWTLKRSGNEYFLTWKDSPKRQAPERAPAKSNVPQKRCRGKSKPKITNGKRKYKSPSQLKRDKERLDQFKKKKCKSGNADSKFSTSEKSRHQRFGTTKLLDEPLLGDIFPFEDLDFFYTNQSSLPKTATEKLYVYTSEYFDDQSWYDADVMACLSEEWWDRIYIPCAPKSFDDQSEYGSDSEDEFDADVLARLYKSECALARVPSKRFRTLDWPDWNPDYIYWTLYNH